jgi:uncharacterized coiled-coil protein SlyX
MTDVDHTKGIQRVADALEEQRQKISLEMARLQLLANRLRDRFPPRDGDAPPPKAGDR